MEEEKKKSKKRVTKEEKHEELEMALMAAGAFLLVVGLKHALGALLEQWRALVFLLLNLVLLSILFTSMRSDSENRKDKKGTQTNKKEMKRKCKRSAPVEELHHYCSSGDAMFEECVEDDEESTEELNKKVEAFIVTFRQQLALDAKGRSRCFDSHGFKADSN